VQETVSDEAYGDQWGVHSIEMRFDILNRLGVDHKCDGRIDGQTEPPLAIARSNDAR